MMKINDIYEITERMRIRDVGILSDIYSKTDIVIRYLRAKGVRINFDARYAKAWYERYYNGKTMFDIAKEFAITTAMVPEWIKRYKMEILGMATELVVQERYFPDYRHLKGISKFDINSRTHGIIIKIRPYNHAGISKILTEGHKKLFVQEGKKVSLILIKYGILKCELLEYDLKLC